MNGWIPLCVAILALVIALGALYAALRTNRKVEVIPAPCQHNWAIIETAQRFNDRHRYLCVGYVYTIQCTHCGDVDFREKKI